MSHYNLQAGPLPEIEGIQASFSYQNAGTSLPKDPSPVIPVLTALDNAQYMDMFQCCKPRDGLLTGMPHHIFGLALY
jgi:epidermal growth factor receptor substrate 15